jgi:ribonuclease BN (tRNA processing enzyme)
LSEPAKTGSLQVPDGGGVPFFLTVLGCDGSYPGPGGACSGYLLRTDGFTTWMDAGPGTMANLQLQISLTELDAAVVSHAHPDHWSDLEGLYVAMRYFLGRRGFPIYAPEGLRDLMRGESPDGTFDWRVIGDGETAEVGPARWNWSRTDHPVETLASRVTFGGRALSYSADTGAAWELSKLGLDVQLALVEASLSQEAEGSMQHLSARQAGVTAASAGAERLVITHLAPPIDRERARAEAAAVFRGPVQVAVVGKTWTI